MFENTLEAAMTVRTLRQAILATRLSRVEAGTQSTQTLLPPQATDTFTLFVCTLEIDSFQGVRLSRAPDSDSKRPQGCRQRRLSTPPRHYDAIIGMTSNKSQLVTTRYNPS